MKHRLAFTPSTRSRAYFEALVKRLTAERNIDVRVTYREAFDYLVNMARKAERDGPPAFNIEGTRMGNRFAQHLLGRKPTGDA